MNPPDWVMAYFADAADRVMAIRDEIGEGKRIGREAERVGKALGFGMSGRGSTSLFARSFKLQRDREIFWSVSAKVEGGTKLDFAYDEVMREMGLGSRAMVVRAYLSIRKLTRIEDD